MNKRQTKKKFKKDLKTKGLTYFMGQPLRKYFTSSLDGFRDPNMKGKVYEGIKS